MDKNEKVAELLLSTEREGIGKLLEWMQSEGYFEAPASSRFHGVYPGGLVDHSLDVFERLVRANDELNLGLESGTMIITAICHDVCKCGQYLYADGKYKTNKAHAKGHGQLSVDIVKQFVQLNELEEKMILYHMGLYGCHEFEERTGEYPLRGGGLANAWYHHPAVKVIYFCDEMSTLKSKSMG